MLENINLLENVESYLIIWKFENFRNFENFPNFELSILFEFYMLIF